MFSLFIFRQYIKFINFASRYTYTTAAFVVKKYVPQTDVIKAMVESLISGGIILHNYQLYDFYRGKKQVKDQYVKSK